MMQRVLGLWRVLRAGFTSSRIVVRRAIDQALRRSRPARRYGFLSGVGAFVEGGFTCTWRDLPRVYRLCHTAQAGHRVHLRGPLRRAAARRAGALREHRRERALAERERGLVGLFSELFDGRDLRLWLRHDPATEPLVKDLPGEAASFRETVHALAALLVRHNLIDEELFERLRERFPRREALIQRIRERLFGP